MILSTQATSFFEGNVNPIQLTIFIQIQNSRPIMIKEIYSKIFNNIKNIPSHMYPTPVQNEINGIRIGRN